MQKNVRYGRISAINAANMTARVLFDDDDNMVSGELNIIVRNSKFNKDYVLPDVGEYVVCLFLDNDRTSGFIVGAVYSQNNLPQQNNLDVRSVDFGDGTSVEYNRKSSTLTINCKGSVNISAGTINISGSGDVVVSGISLVNHKHGGVQSGGSTTGGPV